MGASATPTASPPSSDVVALCEKLRSLIPFLEAHHCKTDAIEEALERLAAHSNEQGK